MCAPVRGKSKQLLTHDNRGTWAVCDAWPVSADGSPAVALRHDEISLLVRRQVAVSWELKHPPRGRREAHPAPRLRGLRVTSLTRPLYRYRGSNNCSEFWNCLQASKVTQEAPGMQLLWAVTMLRWWDGLLVRQLLLSHLCSCKWP